MYTLGVSLHPAISFIVAPERRRSLEGDLARESPGKTTGMRE